ncbi:MAG: hypothetical protein IT271_10055, partial [Chitinophagales bacterium]|nr:hypothetical protein [Chitinophagales bacterium]
MRQKYKIKLLLFSLINILFITNSFCQTAAPAPANSSLSYPVNTILCSIALVLLFIIIILAGTVNGAIELYKINKEKSSSAAKQASILLGLIFISQYAFSQDAAATAAASSATTAANV